MTQADACSLGEVFEERSRSTGKERDAEFGNHYFVARYFGSSMGRFLSPDPVGGSLANPPTLNKSVYVLNNPLMNIRGQPSPGIDHLRQWRSSLSSWSCEAVQFPII